MVSGKQSVDDRKQYLAAIAAKVFWEKGYNTASLRDIADKAKISKAGLYHYFRNKEDILTYIIAKNTEEGEALLTACMADNEKGGVPPELALKRVIQAYATFVNQSKEVRSLVLRERHQLTGTNRVVLHRMEQRVFRMLRNELRKLPQINEAYDVNVITFLIISMSHWMGYWLRDSGTLKLEAAINQGIDVIYHGVLRKGTRPGTPGRRQPSSN